MRNWENRKKGSTYHNGILSDHKNNQNWLDVGSTTSIRKWKKVMKVQKSKTHFIQVFCDVQQHYGSQRNYRFFGDNLPDGTSCGYDRYCLDGECLVLSKTSSICSLPCSRLYLVTTMRWWAEICRAQQILVQLPINLPQSSKDNGLLGVCGRVVLSPVVVATGNGASLIFFSDFLSQTFSATVPVLSPANVMEAKMRRKSAVLNLAHRSCVPETNGVAGPSGITVLCPADVDHKPDIANVSARTEPWHSTVLVITKSPTSFASHFSKVTNTSNTSFFFLLGLKWGKRGNGYLFLFSSTASAYARFHSIGRGCFSFFEIQNHPSS